MPTNLFRRLFHHAPSEKGDAQADDLAPDSTNADAPSRQESSLPPPAAASGPEDIETSIVCREAVLDRQQKVAGYQFLLRKTAHTRIRTQNRRFFHFYAELLIRNLIQANIFPHLGQRALFIEIPDSFLGHSCLTQLPATNTFFILKPVEDFDTPAQESVLTWVRALRKLGYHIGIPNPLATPAYFHLLAEADLVTLQGTQVDIEKGDKLISFILRKAPQASILARDLPGIEDFNFWHETGATLFQGPFITCREHWQRADLGPSFTHLVMLLKTLRHDAETDEIVSIFKQDAAITLRLLRYINSAANGLRERITSIRHAVTLLGHAPLQRWLTLMICSSNRNQPRATAVLETALIRARFMELISTSRPVSEREAIFLTGLLSLIDVILQQPIEHALETLSIDDDIHNAILHGHGPYAATLALARACESMDADRIVSAAEACGIHPEQASACYMDALSWTLALQQEIAD